MESMIRLVLLVLPSFSETYHAATQYDIRVSIICPANLSISSAAMHAGNAQTSLEIHLLLCKITL